MFKKNYVLLVWGLLLILAPIYFTWAIMGIFSNSDVYRAFLDYLHYLVYGFLYSAPGFFAIHFIYLRLREKIGNFFLLKLILMVLGEIGIVSGFILKFGYFGPFHAFIQFFFVAYTIALAILIVFIPIRAQESTETY